MESHLIIYSDGGSRGNPGRAAIGFVIKNLSGEELFREGRAIGVATNNAAEYQALTEGLKKALELKARRVSCYLDSELVVKQLNGQYRVKDLQILNYYRALVKIIRRFEKIDFKHIPREKNLEADSLVNEALDTLHE